MELGQHQSDASPAAAPPAAPSATPYGGGPASAPLHTHTQSTLAPTSEYVRYLLLALPSRYVPRGVFGILFDDNPYKKNWLSQQAVKFSGWAKQLFRISPDLTPKQLEHKTAFAYNTAMGVGSLALTASYSWTVYKDIKNIFAEAVAMETGKAPESINFSDLQNSNNRMVRQTVHNFYWRSFKRGLTDLLFFPAAIMRSERGGDLMVGIKAAQAFTETWKRKTTMFEDLVTFINNKINPRNGLGQSISVGEVFDLYQHYAESYLPDRMFTNVVERGTGEGTLWAQSQPIFERITELMNLTYAYKHSSVIDPKTGHAIHQANFALPQLIYLMGHDLIDVHKPAETLASIEIINRYGVPALREAQAMFASGIKVEQVLERFPIPAREQSKAPIKQSETNGVIAKGSTRQLDQTELPASTIDAASINVLSPGQRERSGVTV